VEEIFHLALEQPPESREQWLDQTCAGDLALRSEVVSLLESDSAARMGFLGAKVQSAFRDLLAGESLKSAMEGRRIGSWRLIREIGRGGMGAVYLAARADQQYESSVAIKLLRPGFDTDSMLARFRRERQILARLDHPNITRLFDGGATEEGIPYFVMEYIEGAWITRYAAGNHLSIEERIRLCLPVCSAVEYAHRNFIVHRDLKPANILIDPRGVPKLLDFGISKLLQADPEQPANTQGGGMLTPEYASPEQILGEPVTIASDVYSLGAVIYELLVGARPHKGDGGSALDLPRAICEDPIPPPSRAAADRAVAKRLRGDLDNIVLCALQRDPARRYVSVERLSGDLRNYLEHRPVAARPDSLGYRASKFIRRNRVAVLLATLAAAAALGGAAMTWREARIANARFQDVRKLATTFVFDVEQAARDLPGSLPVRQLITRTGVEYLNNLARSSARDWALKRELANAYVRIGRVQGGSEVSNLGDAAGAMNSFVSAGKMLDEVLRHTPADRRTILDRMNVYHEIGELRLESGLPADTGPDRAGLRLAQTLLDANPKDPDAIQFAGEFHDDLSALYQRSGNFDASLMEASAAVPLLETYARAHPEDRLAQRPWAESYEQMGAVQVKLGHPQDAIASFRREIAILEAQSQKFPHDTMIRRALMHAYSWLGDAMGNPEHQNAGDSQGAFQAELKMAEQAKYLYEADPADARAAADYGVALLQLGMRTPPSGPDQRRDYQLSEELLNRTLAHDPQSRGNARFKTQVESLLAGVCLAHGEHAAGMRYYAMAIATAEKYLGPHPSVSPTLKGFVLAVRGLAEEQARGGRREEALETLDRALRLAKTLDASVPSNALLPRVNVARSWQAAGSVYTILSVREHGDRAVQDRSAAGMWYRRSLDQWHKLESQNGFANFQHEMDDAALALSGAGLNRPVSGADRPK
jgi:tetratricopeptide (TPR) repeat protein